MKKALSLLLAAAMLFTLSACGEEEPELKVGTVSEGRYENELFGIGCEPGEDWAIADEKELLERAGITREYLGEDFAESVKDEELFFDFYAERSDGLRTINIVIHDLGKLGRAAELDFILDQQLEGLAAEFEGTDFQNMYAERNRVLFAGELREGAWISCELFGTPLYEQQVYLKVGRYLATITLASFREEDTVALAELFYPLG